MNVESRVECAANVIAQPRPTTNSHNVRHVFEDTSRYLNRRQVDIRFRSDAVASFAADVNPRRILDIGCGNGSISLQLAGPNRRLTLMDISSSMVAAARANVPQAYADAVNVRHEDFAVADFDSDLFDLAVSVGVMAHVDCPDQFLGKIRRLLPSGGTLILEFTDAFHMVGRIGRFWGWLREMFAPPRYSTNKLRYANVSKLLKKNRLRLVSSFRYSRFPMPGFNRIVSCATEYKLIKGFFGSPERNRNARLGNEYIMRIVAE